MSQVISNVPAGAVVTPGTGASDQTGNQPQTNTNSGQPGAFKRILATAGGVAGTAAGVMFPGLGALGALGGLTGGLGGLTGGGLSGLTGGGLTGLLEQGSTYGPTAEQYLTVAKQMNAQSEAFEAVTNVMKSKHSSTMNVIQNMGS